eukprot:3458929-Pleurochrysis_carterae.AAC.1
MLLLRFERARTHSARKELPRISASVQLIAALILCVPVPAGIVARACKRGHVRALVRVSPRLSQYSMQYTPARASARPYFLLNLCKLQRTHHSETKEAIVTEKQSRKGGLSWPCRSDAVVHAWTFNARLIEHINGNFAKRKWTMCSIRLLVSNHARMCTQPHACVGDHAAACARAFALFTTSPLVRGARLEHAASDPHS